MTDGERGRHRAWWWARTAGYVLACMLLSLMAGVFSRLGLTAEHGWQALLQGLVLLAGVGVPLTLFWRERAPFAVPLVASAVALVLPIGTSTALVALAGLMSRRRGRRVWWVAGAVALATVVSAVRDVSGPTKETSAFKQVFGPTDLAGNVPVDLSWWVVAVSVLVFLGLAVGAGALLRARRDAALATRAAQDVSRTSDRLNDQLGRTEERERIAREVHDVLGHRLSLLNLHAGALESRAVADPELAESARLVRESARASVDDLRSLLGMLREPLAGGPPDLSLVDLPAVIEETVQTGAPITSTVYIDGAERAGPSLSRAVYRIVQESSPTPASTPPGNRSACTCRAARTPVS
ncbi:histidine kinase [Georgenia yuyongxinii]